MKKLWIAILLLALTTTWAEAQNNKKSKKELEEENTALLEELEQYREQVNNLEINFTQREQDYQTLQAQYADLEQEKQQIIEEKEYTEASFDKVLLQKAEIEQQYQELLENTGKEVENCNQIKNAYKKQSVDLQNALQTIDELEDEIMDKEDDLMFLQEQISRLRQKYED